MSNKTQGYDLAAIRELLLAAFTLKTLRRFCQDRPTFRPIVNEFGPDHELNDMVDRVVDYCETRALFSRLLAEIQQANPDQYARFEPELYAHASSQPSFPRTEKEPGPSDHPPIEEPPSSEARPPAQLPEAQSSTPERFPGILKVGERIQGRYEVKAILKAPSPDTFLGVYHAYDTAGYMGRDVVIKALYPYHPGQCEEDSGNHERAKSRFNRELEALNGITNPNVVTLYHSFEQDSIKYMVLEHIGGGTLADVLRGGQKLDWSSVRQLGHDLCRGLQAIHATDGGTLHLDLAPSNIFLRHGGQAPESREAWAVIGDLGEARVVNAETQKVKLDSDLVGTTGYRAPEIEEECEASYQSDIYSLGVLLFEALTGDKPGSGKHVEESLADAPPSLVKVIEKAIRSNASRRFKDASAMDGQLVSVTPQAKPTPAGRTIAEALVIGIPAALLTEYVIQANSSIPTLLACFALLTTLALGIYWRKEPEKEKYALAIGGALAVLSVVVAVPFGSPVEPPPTGTPTATRTIIPTVTPDRTATHIASQNANATGQAAMASTQTAMALTQTATAPTATLSPTPFPTPTPTHTFTPTPTPTRTPTLTPTPSPTPTSPAPTRRPPTAIPTPTSAPTPQFAGIFSFSALVQGQYKTYVYNLAESTSTPLYIHAGAADADIQPGEHRLAYRQVGSGPANIWRMDIDGNWKTELTHNVEDRAPNWSPGGDELLFSSTREANRVPRIYNVNSADGTDLRTFPIVGQDPVALSERELIFAGKLTYDPGKCGIIYLEWRLTANIVVMGEERITDRCGDLRPDASNGQVVFMRQEGTRSDIWRKGIDFNVTNPVNLTPNTPDSHDALPVFSPDGKWIAFASNRGGSWKIWVTRANGSGEPTVLIVPPAGANFSEWNLSRLSWEQ